MPVLLSKPIIVVMGALVFLLTPVINYTQSIQYLGHRETANTIIFNVKTKESPAQVIIDKNNGNVKINWKNKRDQIEFNIEFGNEIAPQDRETVDQIMKNILEHTKKDKTVKSKIKNWIKNYVNHKL